MRFGITHLVDVLAGKETDKVHGFGHHRLSVFGIADEAELALMKPVARALLARDALRADEYGGLSFGPAARPILKGEEPMELVLPPKRQRRRGERVPNPEGDPLFEALRACRRSEEHTSELQSLMSISYAVFCLKNKKDRITNILTLV